VKPLIVIAAIVALCAHIVPLALGNAVAIRTVSGVLRGDGGEPPARLCDAALRWNRAAWFAEANALLDGRDGAAMPDVPAGERSIRVDQLLLIAASRLRTSCAPAERAVAIAHHVAHDSALGYVTLGNASLRNADRCDHGYLKTIAAYEDAGRTSAAGFRQTCGRAEVWFDAAQLTSNTDVAAALRGYQAAIAADPADDGCGFAWMAAMAKAGFERQRGDLVAARRTLDVAASMSVASDRHAETVRRREELTRR